MNPNPPESGHEVPSGGRGLGPTPVPQPPTPLAKPVSRAVVVVVALALAGVAGFAWLDARNAADAVRAQLGKRLADQDAALAQAKERDSDQTGELHETHAKLALLETRLSELQAQQASLEAQVHDIAPSRDDVLFTEVEQMLLLASQQLTLAANVPAALAALQLADGRLAGTNRVQFLPLRRALAQDMDRLKAVPAIDVPGVAVKLDRALATIDTLPLARDERLPEPPPTPAPPNESQWLAFLRSAWNDVKALVRVEVSDRAAAPLIAPSQQYFLRENLRLRLLAARVALLSRDETSFRSDTAAANAWVKTYFDARSKAVQALLTTLTQIGATVIPADLPDINESLTALRTLKGARDRAGTRAAASQPQPSRTP